MASSLELFELFEKQSRIKPSIIETSGQSQWGTFRDSLRSPVHNWFPYPAGFSHRAVEHAINRFSIDLHHLIYDPFCGTGTTNIVAKTMGINSVGVEAHPFVYFVVKTKIFWEYDYNFTFDALKKIESLSKRYLISSDKLKTRFPELIHNCFSEESLLVLYSIRESIKASKLPKVYEDFFNLALTCILRPAANVGTGWPYIAPKKKKNGKEKDIIKLFENMVLKMCGDVQSIKAKSNNNAVIKIFNADSRDTRKYIENQSVDFIFTSPPYLNNYDYADRTRMETYFLGLAKDWGDITEQVRTKLIMSATTQINRSEYNSSDIISSKMKQIAPMMAKELQSKIEELSEIRLTKGGKKSYDILAGGYFNDMFEVLLDCYRVLKKGKNFALILGDSAPYGVHFPTDRILGKLGKAIGFSSYGIEELRKRGDKWKGNPQRHKVALRESILYFEK